jgi:glutamine amidotransferase
MIAIIDYGVGNLYSLSSSLKQIGVEAVITSDKEVICKADKLILPGVGAFKDAKAKLAENGLDELVKRLVRQGKPIMGICLGMQMLFERSYEYGECEGLGLLKGEVVPMLGAIDKDLKIPHIGWNALNFVKESKLNKYINEGDFVYFVHSFYAVGCDESLISYANYGVKVPATVERENVCGCQFHPEKSGEVGLKILKAFCE